MADDPSERGPVTKGRRFMKLAGLTASVAGNYARTQLKTAFQSAEVKLREKSALHALNGQRMAETLGQLKGAVMKVGQMASIADDVLPKELANALRSLQKEAPPMPFSVIAQQIESEFGAAPETLFRSFDPVPFAAASIGQVHRAVTDDGREVVVKVQYPGVDESCDSDLSHLKFALKAGGLVHLDRRAFNALFEELRARLHEELDYTLEADNVITFGRFHARHEHIKVPRVVGERCSKRVLTLTFEPGDHLSELDDARYTQEVRDELGASLFLMLSEQLVHLGIIHADPNPANLAFRPDGTVVLYDFGCVKKTPPEVVKNYLATIQAALDEDYQAVDEGMIALGARNTSGPALDPAAFYKPWRDVLLQPFLVEGPFDYAASKIHEGVLRLLPAALPKLNAFRPPPDVVFIDRAVVGHYGNMRALRARLRPRRLFEPYVREVLGR